MVASRILPVNMVSKLHFESEERIFLFLSVSHALLSCRIVACRDVKHCRARSASKPRETISLLCIKLTVL